MVSPSELAFQREIIQQLIRNGCLVSRKTIAGKGVSLFYKSKILTRSFYHFFVRNMSEI